MKPLPLLRLLVVLALSLAASPASAPAQDLPSLAALLPSSIEDEDEEIEVKKPAAFSDQELRVLRSVPTLPLERLIELMQIYEKLDNPAMMDVLVRAILSRDPGNAEALRVLTVLAPEEEMRPVGYLDDLGRRVLAGEKVEDIDSVPIYAISLITEGRPQEGVRVLEALRRHQFSGQYFPFLDDLGYALAEAGDFEKSIAAYQEIANDERYGAEARQEAANLLPGLRRRQQTEALRHRAGSDYTELVRLAKNYLDAHPDVYEAITFYIEALDRARRYPEVITFLEGLRSKAGDPPQWPYLPTLAHAYHAARLWDTAIGLFQQIQRNPAFDPATRLDAETMLVEIHVGREIENGLAGLERADYARGRATLENLERDFPNHPDLLGYRAIYLAKTGQPDEALLLLQSARSQAESQGLPFTQLDALADVHLERKEFDAARAAVHAIINDPRQDPFMREAAVVKLVEIGRTELLEQGFLALQDGNRRRARVILQQLESEAPNSIEVALYRAEVELAFNRVEEARQSLAMLKTTRYPGAQPFPGQNALATATYRRGRYAEAEVLFTEILEQPGYSKDDLLDARWNRRDLHNLLTPTLTADLTFQNDFEGNQLVAQSTFSTAWNDGWQFSAFALNESFWLNSEATYLSRLRSNRFEAGVTVRRALPGGHYASATIGGQPDGILYGVEVGLLPNPGLNWSVGFLGNARSSTSGSIGVLNGRENRAYTRLSGQINDRWLVDAEAFHSWLNVSGDSLGTGYGFVGAIDYILQTETYKRPEISVGYTLEYSRYRTSNLPAAVRNEIRRALVPQEEVRSALAADQEVRRAIPASLDRDVLDSLVDPLTHRHGLRMTIRKRLNDQWAGYIQAGVYYAVDDATLEHTAAAGAQYYLSEDALLYAELRYDSNGRALNTGNGVWEANIGGLVNF